MGLALSIYIYLSLSVLLVCIHLHVCDIKFHAGATLTDLTPPHNSPPPAESAV